MKRIIYALMLFFSVSVYAQKAGRGLQFDLGTEPEENGNVSYGMLQWGWTDNIASRMDIRYSTKNETSDDIEGYANVVQTTKENTFEADLLPIVKYLGNEKNFSVSLGASYQFSREKAFAGMFDVNGYMLDEVDEGKYFTMENARTTHIIAPRVGFTAKIPFAKYFKFGFESFVHPIYCLSMKQDMAYHSDQTATAFDYSGDNSYFKVSSPYIDAKATLDMFDYVRLMSRVSFQRLDFQQMDWNDNFYGLEGKDDTQTITTFRAGVELLSKGTKARVRGGLYREMGWNKSTYRDDTETSSRWVISFGTEL